MRGAGSFLLLVAAAAAVGSEKKAASNARSPQRLFLARCSTCHDPGRVYHRDASRDEWREIVLRMQRMPQSGIAPKEAETILSYLVSLRGRAPARPPAGRRGGRAAYGDEWLSILEVATVRDGKVRLGGRTYDAKIDGLTAALKRGRKSWTAALGDDGRPALTARLDGWTVGEVAYEIHLVFYEVRGGRVRLARALRRAP